MTTQDLLYAWREATRAAELAARLAKQAVETAERAEVGAAAAEEIAELAEKAAEAAATASQRARAGASEARRIAQHERGSNVPDAQAADVAAGAVETEARDAYHQAEADAYARNQGGSRPQDESA